jgi:hypothetical protein
VRATPYVASLRVYEPISAFDAADRLRWQGIENDASSFDREQKLALHRVAQPEPPAGRPDGVHIIDKDDIRYLSPWSTATRCWAALDNFKDSLPSTVVPFFVSPALEEVITAGVDLLEDKTPHILNETWLIPPRWFILYSPEERSRGIDEHGFYSKALTTIANAKQRCASAHESVLGAFGEGPVEEELENLLDWLEMFHPESLVELDYGGLANYMDKALRDSGEDGLDSDSSIEDVMHSVAGLAASDAMMAGVGYQRLMSRWRLVQAFEQAS